MLALVTQALFLLVARAYYAAGNTRTPLILGVVDIIVSIASSLLLLWSFENNQLFQSFVGALLRVSDVPGTSVLMLALGDSIGSIVQCLLGVILLARDFSVPVRGVGRLFFQTFCASVIGGACTYATLLFFGPLVDTTTLVGIVSQGVPAGIVGLLSTAGVLWILGSQELKEILGALSRHLRTPNRVAVEPTDVS